MSLTPQQEQVLALISAGSTISDAAQSAGIHRNTVYNWVRSAKTFRQALANAREAKAVYWHEQAEPLAAQALDTIRTLMTDPQARASVRLKAAQIILNLATNPIFVTLPNSAQSGAGDLVAGIVPAPRAMPNSAQSDAGDLVAGIVPAPHAVPNSAQSGAAILSPALFPPPHTCPILHNPFVAASPKSAATTSAPAEAAGNSNAVVSRRVRLNLPRRKEAKQPALLAQSAAQPGLRQP